MLCLLFYGKGIVVILAQLGNMIYQALRLFCKDCSIKISGGMQYRKNFLTSIIISILYSFVFPLFQLMFFKTTRGFDGWTIDQVMFFQSIFLLWTGIIQTLFNDVLSLMGALVLQGGFDRLLLLPYPPLLSLFTRGFNYYSLGSVLTGFIGAIYFIVRLEVAITLPNITMFLILLLFGLVFYAALLIICCSFILRWTYFSRMREILEKLFFFTSMPAEVFNGTSKLVYMVIFPISIWAYFPAQALLNRLNVYVYPSMLVCVVFFILSIFIWDHHLKRYTSAGG